MNETLQRARAAYALHDWAAARDAFQAAAAQEPLAPDDLAALGETAWWLGRTQEADRRFEEAHRGYLGEERHEKAAAMALTLAVNHFLRGESALGSGWLGRAFRLVADLPEAPVHGYLTYIRDVEANFGGGSAGEAAAAAERIQELGHRTGDANLVALGLSGEGRALLKKGELARGMALLDEAMVLVLSGELSPEWAGNIYCNTISACHELSELRRMLTWTEATERWLATLPAAVLFTGICRVHRAQLLNLNGDWERAEREARRVCTELAGISAANVAEAHYQVGEVRRLRGDFTGAETAYRAAREHGRDPHPGLALLRLAQGRSGAAAASIRTALVAARERPARAPLCAAQVRIALACGDRETARRACEELTGIAADYAGPGFGAMALASAGAVALADDLPDRALPALREACRRWRELSAPYEAAHVRLLLARAYASLGDADAMALELDAASVEFDRLGAAPDAAGAAELHAPPSLPGGLSGREGEVLRLVAQGRSNAEIAAELFISQKTVARHLSNIFAKLGVTSRTRAARLAFEHHLL